MERKKIKVFYIESETPSEIKEQIKSKFSIFMDEVIKEGANYVFQFTMLANARFKRDTNDMSIIKWATTYYKNDKTMYSRRKLTIL